MSTLVASDTSRLVYLTCPSEAVAMTIAEALVSERIAACANLIPGMRSIYRWQGRICHDQEWVLIVKTDADRLTALADRVRALHPYQVPCLVVLPIVAGTSDFLGWISAQTRPRDTPPV